MQLPNRGLIYVALVATLPAARLVDAVVAGPAPTPWLLAAGLTLVTVTGLEPAEYAKARPTDGLREAGIILREEVPSGGRFAYVSGPTPMGTPAPERWLAWSSGQPGLAPFGPEYAPGAAVAMRAPALPADHLDPSARSVVDWVDQLRQLSVTHIVVADPAWEKELARTARVRLLPSRAPTVWAVKNGPGAPVGSVVPADRAVVLSAAHDRYEIDVTRRHRAADTRMAIGWSPGWRAWIDGVEVRPHRTTDDRLGLDVPAGRHRITLRFDEPPPGAAARWVSAMALVALAATTLSRRIRRASDFDRNDDLPKRWNLGARCGLGST